MGGLIDPYEDLLALINFPHDPRWKRMSVKMDVDGSKFEEYDNYEPALDAQIIVFSPKEYIDVYKNWFYILTCVLVFLKANPELKDIMMADLVKHQSEIMLQIIKTIEEKKKHA